MFKFKRSLVENKTMNNQKKKYGHKRHIIIFSSICILAFITTILIAYFSRENKTEKEVQQSGSISSLSTIITSVTEDHTPELIHTEQLHIDIEELDNNSMNDYIIKFYDLFTEIKSKLYKGDSQEFHDTVETKAKSTFQIAFNKYKEMKQYSDKIDYLVNQSKQTSEAISDIKATNYNNVLFEFGNMLYISHKIFRPNAGGYYKPMDSNAHDSKFIYQQLHIGIIINTVTKIIDNYLSYISNKLLEYYKNGIFKELTTDLYLQLEVVKDKLFEKYNAQVGFLYKGKDIVIENLMTHFGVYDKFLKLNLYVVFMHLFRLNLAYTVDRVSSYFGMFFLNKTGNDPSECIQKRIHLVARSCQGVFHLTLLIGDGTGYFNMESEPFEKCCLCLFEDICGTN